MEWLKIILPLIGVLIGWFLNEQGKLFAYKRQDKRKIKKLLFFLLELRFQFHREATLEDDLKKYIELVKNKLIEKTENKIGENDLNEIMAIVKPILNDLVLKAILDENKYDFFVKNIDEIIIELSEIAPILAYELNGQHNIKEKLKLTTNYFEQINEKSAELIDIKDDLINPKLIKELLRNLDESIADIARKIDKKTLKNALKKIQNMNSEEHEREIEKLIDEMLEKLQNEMS